MAAPDRANNPARRPLLSRVGKALNNAGHFAMAMTTLGATNYDPDSNHQINHIQDRKINDRMRQEAHEKFTGVGKNTFSSNNLSGAQPTRKNDVSIWD